MAEDGAVQRIVVGVDGSETSKAALRWAAALARAFGVELEAVRALRYPPALHDWSALPSNYGFLPALPPEDVVGRGVHDDLAELVAAELGQTRVPPCGSDGVIPRKWSSRPRPTRWRWWWVAAATAA